MKKSIVIVGSLIVAMSLLVCGCSNQTANNTTPAQTTATEETTAETTTAIETTEAPTTEAQMSEEEKTAMTSGTTEAFEKYFNLDTKPYFQKNEKAGKTEEITYHSEVLNADRQAIVYTPYDYDPEKTYPVMYLIHGIGCDSGQWVSMSAARLFDNMIANGELSPFIAVFPSVIPVEGIDPNTLSDTNINAFKDFVEEYDKDLRPYLVEHFNISTEREKTAICGLSMGGMEALRVGFTYLDQFNYIGSFSAAPTLEMELLTTEGSDYVPQLVLVCSGDQDGTVGENPMNYHKELEKNGVEHIWYQHPGGNHSTNVWNLGLLNFAKRIQW